MLIRAVEPHVVERRRGPQHAGQVRPAHDAVGDAMPLQQVEVLLAVPARVSDLEAYPYRASRPVWVSQAVDVANE